jgi:hypothetical protein
MDIKDHFEIQVLEEQPRERGCYQMTLSFQIEINSIFTIEDLKSVLFDFSVFPSFENIIAEIKAYKALHRGDTLDFGPFKCPGFSA